MRAKIRLYYNYYITKSPDWDSQTLGMWRGSRPVGHCPKFGSERPETGDRGGGLWAETRGEHNEESGARHSVTTHSGPGDPPLIGQWLPLIGQWSPHTGLWLVTLLLPTIWVFSLPGCWQMVFVFSDSHFLLLQAQSHKLLSGEKQEIITWVLRAGEIDTARGFVTFPY